MPDDEATNAETARHLERGVARPGLVAGGNLSRPHRSVTDEQFVISPHALNAEGKRLLAVERVHAVLAE